MSDHSDPGASAVRSGPEERAYLLRRASDHRGLAEQAGEAETRSVHLRLCRLYEEQAARLD
jgi:hypothetical protein